MTSQNPLKDLIGKALDEEAALSSALRLAMVMGYRLDFEDLVDWVQHELDGYPEDVDAPDYRSFSARSYASLRNPYVGTMSSADVLRSGQPDWVKEYIDRPIVFREGIAAIQTLAAGDGELRQPWQQEMAVRFGAHSYIDFECLSAWKLVPRHQVKGLLDTVRNRLLRFALELEKNFEWIGESAPEEAIQNPGAVSQIFNTFVLGGTAQVVTGAQAEVQTLVAEVGKGDASSLASALQQLGLTQADIAEALEIARVEHPSSEEPGPRTRAWLEHVKAAAAEKLTGMPVEVATTLAIEALKQFLGMG